MKEPGPESSPPKMSGLPAELEKEILKKGKLFEVGGAVRDFLRTGKETAEKDFLITGIPLEELTAILKKYGKVDLVGKSFGVIKFCPGDSQDKVAAVPPGAFDIALPRQEHSTGVGHKDFKVSYDHNLKVEDDLGRRDFSINAMAKDVADGKIIDPFGGQRDLEGKILRQVFKDAFLEDPLRMLRGIQFAARFEFEIEKETFEAMQRNAHMISTVSPERIAEELNKLLAQADKPSVGFRLMQKSGLLRHVLPELEVCVGVDQPGGWHKYDVFEHTLITIDNCRKDLTIRLAALFHDINKPQTKHLKEDGATFYSHEVIGGRTAEKVMSRLRYSNDLIYAVRLLVEKHMFTTQVTDKGLRRLIKKTEGRIFDLLELRKADIIAQGRGSQGVREIEEFEKIVQAELDRKPPISLNDLKIDGEIVMKKLKLKPGPAVGKILNHLLEKVLDDPQFNQEEFLLEEAKRFWKENQASPSQSGE